MFTSPPPPICPQENKFAILKMSLSVYIQNVNEILALLICRKMFKPGLILFALLAVGLKYKAHSDVVLGVCH